MLLIANVIKRWRVWASVRFTRWSYQNEPSSRVSDPLLRRVVAPFLGNEELQLVLPGQKFILIQFVQPIELDYLSPC